ncbi:hypothetical protein P9848_11210 [Geobacillus stearothermophilus]|uniref:hypothetical protein n=1 Tax=Geobacillus stearothermophilus TaxID=1422 RepID=UPI002E23FEF3|nr:hypothetical protein [Geobacillus stearothermophilus]
MSELLTTGQMIDRLKPGEVAECVNAEAEKLESKRVKINDSGNLQYLDGYGFIVTEFMRTKAKWRILPRYVTFDRAMKALAEGKTVWAWKDGRKQEGYWIDRESGRLCRVEIDGSMATEEEIGFFKDWTIEEDK